MGNAAWQLAKNLFYCNMWKQVKGWILRRSRMI